MRHHVRIRVLLDVGGSPEIWKLCPVRPRLTLLNIRGYVTELPFVVGDAVQLPFREGAFDVVFSNSLIEHLPLGPGRCSRMSVVE